jgi:hypothetical protein
MTTTFTPGPSPNTVRAADGKIVTIPEGWILLPPGDAALTRRIKAAGEHFAVAEKKGRRVFSRGIWTSAATVERIRAELEHERSTEGFAKRKDADAKRREKAQAEYVPMPTSPTDWHVRLLNMLHLSEVEQWLAQNAFLLNSVPKQR